jgi:chaperonin GroES
MEVFPMNLLGDLVVIRPEETPQAKILLPDWQRSLRGTVIGVGPGKMLVDGSRVPMELKVGDFVTFGATAGMESIYAGKPIRTMREDDVHMVIEERASTGELLSKLEHEFLAAMVDSGVRNGSSY